MDEEEHITVRWLFICITIVLCVVSCSGCAGIPDADTGITPQRAKVPCEVHATVDGRPACLQRREIDEILSGAGR